PLQAFLRVHRTERGRAAIRPPVLPFVIALGTHRGESAKPAAAEDLRRSSRDLEVLESLGVDANPDRAVFVLRLDVAVPEAGVLQDVSVGIDGAGELQFLDSFERVQHWR